MALTSPSVPVIVTEDVRSPLSSALPDAVRSSVPWLAVSVTVTGPKPLLMAPSSATLSGSAMLMPWMASGWSSPAVGAFGSVIAGASLTGVMAMVKVPVGSVPPPASESL